MRSRQLLALVAGLALTLSVCAQAPAAQAAAPLVTAAADAAPAADRMPGDVPSKKTPWVLDGRVNKIVQVGSTMIAGGLFTQVADPMNGTPLARQNLVAFDATTGLVSQTFNPTVDGEVQQLLPGPTPDTVYVAGDFTKINDKGPNHLQLINVNTGLAVSSFKAPSTSGSIQTMELLPDNRLFIGGFFKKLGGVDSGQFVTLNATTGARRPVHEPRRRRQPQHRHRRQGADRTARVGPDAGRGPPGGRGQLPHRRRGRTRPDRDDRPHRRRPPPCRPPGTPRSTPRSAPPARSTATCATSRCRRTGPSSWSRPRAARTAARCATPPRASRRTPPAPSLTATWVANSGGDTLWGVEVTRAAVYVGGHNRWMNNPSGSDRAGQGAVPRPGLSALDPQSGVPLKWNPGRNPRGEAAYEIYETDAGVWVVSDTDWVGNRRYQRPRIAFFPYAEGSNTASKSHRLAARQRLRRRAARGHATCCTASTPAARRSPRSTTVPTGSPTTARPSTLHNTGSTAATRSALTVDQPDQRPGLHARWASGRPSATTPAAAPTCSGPSRSRPARPPRCASTSPAGRRPPGASTSSSTASPGCPATTPTPIPGVNRGTMKSFDITSDGTVNIDFTRVTGDPLRQRRGDRQHRGRLQRHGPRASSRSTARASARRAP